MNLLKGRRGWMIGAFIGYAVLALGFSAAHNVGASQPSLGGIGPAAFTAPTYSSPIAIDADQGLLWVVNPDADTVSVINIASADPANYTLVKSIQVGDEPQSIALDTISATQYNAYVANAAGNSVSVIRVDTSGTLSAVLENTLTTGAEPWNIVAHPTASVSSWPTAARTRSPCINTADPHDHRQRGHSQQRVQRPRPPAATSSRAAWRSRSTTPSCLSRASCPSPNPAACRPATMARRAWSADSPLTPRRDRRDRAKQPHAGHASVAGLPASPTPNGAATKAYPNQMQSIVIRGDRAYLPNIAASPERPAQVQRRHPGVCQPDQRPEHHSDRRWGAELAPGRAQPRGGQDQTVLRQPVGDRLHQPERRRQCLRGLGRQRPAGEAECRRGRRAVASPAAWPTRPATSTCTTQPTRPPTAPTPARTRWASPFARSGRQQLRLRR